MIAQDRTYQVIEAANGSEALQKCGFQQFDVVILDMKMPRKDGLEVIEMIEKMPTQSRPRAVIVVSGNFDSKRLEDRLTEYLCFSKPFSIKELMTAVLMVTHRAPAAKAA